jgi:hypothetical protein
MTHPMNAALDHHNARERTRVAFHEAGHAVVARWAGLKPGRVRVDQITGGGGCWHDAPRPRRDRVDALRGSLVVAVAGVAAEQLAGGVDPLNAAVPPAEIARRIISRERATQAEPRPEGGSLRHPDTRRWAVDELSDWLSDEALAYELVDEILAPDALRRAVRILLNRWLEVESIVKRLEAEGDIHL